MNTDVDTQLAGTEIYEEASALIRGLVSALRRIVKNSESAIKLSHAFSPQVDLERTYFHEMVEMLFGRTVESFGKLIDQVKPPALQKQLREDMIFNVKRMASMVLIDSDLCRTALMEEFSELMTRLVADLERVAHSPKVAA